MKQLRPTLTIHRKTDRTRTHVEITPEEKDELVKTVTRKKKIVVNSPPAWRLKKQELALKEQEQEKKTSEMVQSAEKLKPAYRKMMPLADALSLLQTYWPALVIDGIPQLLAVNIRDALLLDIRQRELSVSVKKLKRCLATITRSDAYLDSMVPGAVRKNIHGLPVAEITTEETMFARRRKEQEHARLARKQHFEHKQ